MFLHTSDIYQYKTPVTVTHQGKAIYFVSQRNESSGNTEFFYNALNPTIAAENDSMDWSGYQKLVTPATVSMAGFNILRAGKMPKLAPLFSVISDQKYIYLFMTSGNRIYSWRYVMALVPGQQNQGNVTARLQPAWEVRFRRSEKPDTPVNEADSQNFIDMGGQPFVAPAYVIALGGKDGNFQIDDGQFTVNLVPADKPDGYRWQFFVVNKNDQLLYTYSLGRNDDGWFSLEENQYSKVARVIRPDHVVSLFQKTTSGEAPVKFTGAPTSVVYARQEPAILNDQDQVKLRNSYRLKLMAQVTGDDGNNSLANLDFAVSAAGTLAFISPAEQTTDQRYLAGNIEPMDYSLAFDTSFVEIPGGETKITLGNSFVQQLWVYPQDDRVGVNYLLGNSAGIEKKKQPPLLWIENKTVIGFGFGDGENFYSGATRDGVLALNKWNNIIAAFDGTQYVVYVNGIQVSVNDKALSKKAPYATAINAMGMGDPAGDKKFLYGYLDEVRIWNNFSEVKTALQYLYKEIPQEEALAMKALVAYWRLDEGTGITTQNFSSLKEKLNGTLMGAKWMSGHAPAGSDNRETTYIDPGTMLTLDVGIINPKKQIDKFRNFGNVKPGTKPALFDSADGLLHLYYEGTDNRFYVAQFDSSTVRALFQTPWVARATSEADNINGRLYFTARQPGTLMNQASINLKRENNPFLCTVELGNNAGTKETFRGVPIHIPSMVSILGGAAVSVPGNYEFAGTPVFYDYTGKRNVGYQPYGPPDLFNHLLFISNYTEEFILHKVENTVTGSVADVKLTFHVGAKSEAFVKTFREVPVHASSYIQTLQGMNEAYQYNGEKTAGDSSACSIPAGNNFLLALIPDAGVEHVSIAISSGSGNATCDVVITLTDKSGKVDAGWKNVPRLIRDFISTIKTSSGDKQKRIADKLFFLPDNSLASIDNGVVNAPAGLLSVINLFDVYHTGNDGDVGTFICNLDKAQGTARNGLPVALTQGSELFMPYVTQQSNNGYPAVINFNGVGNEAELIVVGEDGGWFAESPRKAIDIPLNAGLTVSPDGSQKKFLDLTRDLTMESWVSTVSLTPDMKPPLPDYPRIVHSNLTDGSRKSQYMLGVTPSFALQFLAQTQVTVSDSGQAANVKLFKGNSYSIQFYIKPDLETIRPGQADFIYQRREPSNNTGESLKLAANGTLTFSFDGQSVTLTNKNKITTQTWTFITVTRSGDVVRLYLNGKLDNEITNAPKATYVNNDIRLGGNQHIVSLQMELNQFTVWQRSQDGNEILARYQKPVESDSDGLILLWALNRYNSDGTIKNIARLGTNLYDTKIQGKYFWDYPGVFHRMFGAVGGTGVIMRDALIAENSWNHFAGVYFMNYGITTGGVTGAFANCGHDRSFDVSDQFTIEAWIYQNRQTNLRQVIFSKFGKEETNQSFEFGLDSANKPYIDVRVSGQKGITEKERHHLVTSTAALQPEKPYFVAVTVSVTSHTIDVDKKEGKATRYNVSAQIMINDQPQTIVKSADIVDPVTISASTADATIGATRPDSAPTDRCPFQGIVSNLSFWGTALADTVMAGHYNSRKKLTSEEGLISVWHFGEQEGRYAFDSKFQNTAILSSSDMWAVYPHSASLKLYLNGKEEAQERIEVAALGGFGATQTRFGNMLDQNSDLTNTFSGRMDELRLWSQARTREQIADNMFTSLVGDENYLNGYWKFDAGSGTVVTDMTGRGNDARFTGTVLPQWTNVAAPVSNEAPPVINAIGGEATTFSESISGSPAVVEYADTQYDYYGNMFSVIKRCYVYNSSDQVLKKLTGFKIGDLQQVYIGQVQSDPTIVGFVEGPPPLPSENLTKPDFTDPMAYYGKAALTLAEQKDTTVTYSATSADGDLQAFSIKAGVKFEVNKAEVIGMPPYETSIQSAKFQAELGATLNLSWNNSEEKNRNLQSTFSAGKANTITNRGNWEIPDATGKYILNTGERRYLPANEGIALVKSATADIFGLFLKTTGALISFSVVPNRDIPVDVNYLYFPIDPHYTKNGTLDGKIGLQNDPDYPNANVLRGSYFKPVEAYSLRKRIETDTAAINAYYMQFNAASRAKSENFDMSDTITSNSLYDWDTNAFKKDIVNTYVWTAAGGFYAEQNNYTSIVQETYNGKYEYIRSISPYGTVELAMPFGGIKAEASFLKQVTWTVNVQKSKSEEAALTLEANVDPDAFLGKYTDTGDGYDAKPAPGKVDTYRFMSFYLASNKSNTDDLFSKVVDQNWLYNSGDSRAKALLQAKGKAGNAWRIFHRVSFVSRVPPEFQNFPAESQAPALAKPVHITANDLLIEMVKAGLSTSEKPTPEIIGKTVRQVILEDLKTTIPWWSEFLVKASVYNSDENKTLVSLIQDTINYMVLYFKTVDD